MAPLLEAADGKELPPQSIVDPGNWTTR
jgi:hypothetical protein